MQPVSVVKLCGQTRVKGNTCPEI